jgi:hypothetical protein
MNLYEFMYSCEAKTIKNSKNLFKETVYNTSDLNFVKNSIAEYSYWRINIENIRHILLGESL